MHVLSPLLMLFTAAPGGEAPARPPRVLLELQEGTLPCTRGDLLRELRRELGADAIVDEAPAAVVRIERSAHAHRVRIECRDEEGGEAGREVVLPREPQDAAISVALLVRNLCQDEARGLVEGMARPEPPEAPPPPRGEHRLPPSTHQR